MTPEAKKALSNTIRDMRQWLLEGLHVATESGERHFGECPYAVDTPAATAFQRLEQL